MFETSQSTEKLDAVLAKAQGEIEVAHKDKPNPAFKAKYADLTSIWTAIRAALAKHQISVTQWPIHSADDRVHVITRLAHAGEWMKAEYSIPVMKKDAHGYGSATSYARRYSLAAAIGVVAEEDDDGNASIGTADERSRGNGRTASIPPSQQNLATPLNATAMVKAINSHNSEATLRAWTKANKAAIAKLSSQEMDLIQDAYDKRLAFLAQAPNGDDVGAFNT